MKIKGGDAMPTLTLGDKQKEIVRKPFDFTLEVYEGTP